MGTNELSPEDVRAMLATDPGIARRFATTTDPLSLAAPNAGLRWAYSPAPGRDGLRGMMARRLRADMAETSRERRDERRRDFFAARMIDGICGGRVFGARAAARDERGHLADAERRAWTFGHAAPHHLYAPAYGATCRAIDILAARVEIRGGRVAA